MLHNGWVVPLKATAELRRQAPSSPNSQIPAHIGKSEQLPSLGIQGKLDTGSRTLHKAKHQYIGLYKDIEFRALKLHLFFSCSSFSILWDATYVEKRWQHLVRSLTNSTMASSLDMFPRAAHSLLQRRTPKVTSSS